ncbi:MAG: DUF5606 domain-containing protein [Candidatus Azobacteroides sp.]|nr:DUF5606 domain-containing protein [Candidatus Azobacteroides sp.]
MLKEILSVSGKPGLYKLVSKGKNMFIVESFLDRKRIPVYMRDKVVALGDISVYTKDGEVPLSTILTLIKEKENGLPVDVPALNNTDLLREYFRTAFPDFDESRVYPSDIKKMLMWYNILIKEGITEFQMENEEEGTENEEKSGKDGMNETNGASGNDEELN